MCFKKTIISLAVLWLATSLAAQTKVTNSVIGSGGTPVTGGSSQIVGTVGQAAIGQATSPANDIKSGFWQQTAGLITSVEELSTTAMPTEFRLQQNYPNPFNPQTTIRYDLPVQSDVRLTLFDVLGRTVRTLVDAKQPAGAHTAVWDGRDDRGRQLASGVYVYRITAGTFKKSAKMLLLK